MSELTSCNFCNLNRIKAKAKKEGKKVILKRSNFMGGTDVFTVPEGTTLPAYKEPSDTLPNGCEAYQKYHKSWMMEIPRHCCC
jgi:hypothetical protein